MSAFPFNEFRKFLQQELGISDVYKTNQDEFLRDDAQAAYLAAKWVWGRLKEELAASEMEADSIADQYERELENSFELQKRVKVLELKNLELRVKVQVNWFACFKNARSTFTPPKPTEDIEHVLDGPLKHEHGVDTSHVVSSVPNICYRDYVHFQQVGEDARKAAKESFDRVFNKK